MVALHEDRLGVSDIVLLFLRAPWLFALAFHHLTVQILKHHIDCIDKLQNSHRHRHCNQSRLSSVTDILCCIQKQQIKITRQAVQQIRIIHIRKLCSTDDNSVG